MPRQAGTVLMYTCGPTVYGQQHIGNLRPALLADTIARTLQGAGYRVVRVINITDVGHLVGDVEDGAEDKIAVTASREKVSPSNIAERYARLFIDDLGDLGIDTTDIRFPRATEYIEEQIAFATTLEQKGYAYRLPEGLYFDTQKIPDYGKLGGVSGAKLVGGARVEVIRGKRHPADFALWRTAKPHDLQQWHSPWGRGNPGWHIECSTMARSLLGIELDIHTGGEDLAMVHHNDEIAQSEAANGRPFVRYWLHNAFLTMGGEKISKSLGNVVYLSDFSERGYHPLALRYFYLQGHYRTPLSFTWEALAGAAVALERLWRMSREIKEESGGTAHSSDAQAHFLAAMRDDLATPQALSVLWDALKSEDYSPEEKWGLIVLADAHLGLVLTDPPTNDPGVVSEISEDLAALLADREQARREKDFAKADQIRAQLAERGYRVDDGPNGPVLTKSVL